MAQKSQTKSLFTADLVVPAIQASFVKLNPKELIRNPVMFVTAAVAALMTVLLVIGQDDLTPGFKLQLVVWLWLTVLFGTFAEALAEGRGKAQAASLRAAKAELTAKRLKGDGRQYDDVAASQLKIGDIVLVETGDLHGARLAWRQALARTQADTEARTAIAARLAVLEYFIAQGR